MEVIGKLENLRGNLPSAVALGSFDGIHYGHQALIKTMVEEAGKQGLKSMVFSFSNHPRDLIPGKPKVKNILYKDEKEAIIAGLNVDALVAVPFDEEVMKLSPREFVLKFLVEGMNAKEVFCGFNYRFGYKAEGTPEFLDQLGKEFGFEVTVIPTVKIDGNIVSSSMIRTIIAAGQVEKCPMYMGRYYTIGGNVVIGNKLGRKLGFPTSNLVIDENMVTPPNGVYATYCVYNGKRYPSVTNLGVKPTVGSNEKNVETHIFDFNKELYGSPIKVEFLKKMRDEVKFDDYRELADQIERDVRETKRFFAENP